MTDPVDHIAFALPDITEDEIEAVAGVLRSRWLTTGARVREFEAAFTERVGARHGVALNSATAALHLSLEALGVGSGDLVFVPTYTFAASAEVVRYMGAVPVLIDVDPITSNIDVQDLRTKILTSIQDGPGSPKVIMPVHFAGVACDMDEIWNLAREFNLAVVEDAAHAFPSSYNGRPIGWMPEDIRGTVCYSFYATKTITTGEGGMLVTNDSALADRARLMSLHGLSKQAWNRYDGGGWKYDIVAPGYKYNLTDIAAAMGIVQLRRAEAMRARRSEIAASYDSAFAGFDSLVLPVVPAGKESAWHLYALRVSTASGEEGRDRLIEQLGSGGIRTSVHFIPLHLHSYYKSMFDFDDEDLPVALDSYRRVVSLPIWSAMDASQVQRVVQAVTEWARAQ